MLFGTGSIDNLLAWFNNKCEAGYLCLLVCGSTEDGKLFKTFLSSANLGQIDVVTGREIVFFTYVKYDINSSSAIIHYDMGRSGLDPIVTPFVPLQDELLEQGQQCLRAFHVSEYKRMLKEFDFEPSDKGGNIPEVALRASQTASVDLQRLFDIEDDQLPCILTFEKFNLKPFIVETRGVAEVKQLLEFLRGLKAVEKMFTWTDQLKVERILKAGSDRIQKIIVSRDHLDNAQRKLSNAIKDVRASLLAAGMSDEEAGTLLVGDSKSSVADRLVRLAEELDGRDDHGLREKVHDLLNNKIFRERCRSFDRWSNQVGVFQRKLDKLGPIRGGDESVEASDLYARYKDQKQALEAHFEKYRSSFFLKSKVQPIAEFFARVAKFGKEVKDPAEVMEKIVKLATGAKD